MNDTNKRKGQSVMRNKIKAAVFALTVASSMLAGSAIAGLDEGFEAHKRKEYATAMREWMPLAIKGDAAAQNNVGSLYASGEGVPVDYKEAIKWQQMSAAQGYFRAQNNVGLAYRYGRGVKVDHEESLKWFLLSANQGYAGAQDNLGYMYANGIGTRQDYKEAVRWYRLAAAQGSSYAQANLGLAYAKGNGVPQSDMEAVKWYGRAADQGHADAKVSLKEYTDAMSVIRLRGAPGYCQSDSSNAQFWKKVEARATADLAANKEDLGAMNCLASLMYMRENWDGLIDMASKMEPLSSRYEMGVVCTFFQESYRAKGNKEKLMHYAKIGSSVYREIGEMWERGVSVVNVNAKRK
jgi:hypothetical protein